jgi:hypothetical protein
MRAVAPLAVRIDRQPMWTEKSREGSTFVPSRLNFVRERWPEHTQQRKRKRGTKPPGREDSNAA